MRKGRGRRTMNNVKRPTVIIYNSRYVLYMVIFSHECTTIGLCYIIFSLECPTEARHMCVTRRYQCSPHVMADGITARLVCSRCT